jgi:acetyl/propionyl-CoA carboxylase alpha subunit
VYQLPEGKGIRVDNGFEQMDIPIYYDPMFVITYGETREETIEIMINATSIITLLKVCKQPCLFGKYVMEHDALDQEIFDTCKSITMLFIAKGDGTRGPKVHLVTCSVILKIKMRVCPTDQKPLVIED